MDLISSKKLPAMVKDFTASPFLPSTILKPADSSEKSPVTGDSMNVTVFAVIALLAVAGLAVIGKKRFAL